MYLKIVSSSKGQLCHLTFLVVKQVINYPWMFRNDKITIIPSRPNNLELLVKDVK